MARKAGRLIALAAVAAGSAAAGADTPVSALAGRYSQGFANGMVDGTKYRSENIVEVVAVDASHAYVRLDLEFYNGHSCHVAGIAQATGAALTYVEPVDARSDDSRCRLTMRRSGAKLTWDDAGTCKDYCGARGSYTKGELPWASKRPIRYLARLKGSTEYRKAMTEWRTGRMVQP